MGMFLRDTETDASSFAHIEQEIPRFLDYQLSPNIISCDQDVFQFTQDVPALLPCQF
jgi:hypothetical protein